MCGRFTQAFSWPEVVEFYRLVDEIAPHLSASWNAAPTHNAGVIVLSGDGLRFQPMRWGLVPHWAKDPSIASKLINARAETLGEKPAFRQALRLRRCVVPITGFYEWRRQGRGKQPYFITAADRKPLTLAGLWEDWNGLLTFTIVTVPANEKLAPNPRPDAGHSRPRGCARVAENRRRGVSPTVPLALARGLAGVGPRQLARQQR